MGHEWILTEAVQVRVLDPEGLTALFRQDGVCRAVCVKVTQDPTVLYLNEELYVTSVEYRGEIKECMWTVAYDSMPGEEVFIGKPERNDLEQIKKGVFLAVRTELITPTDDEISLSGMSLLGHHAVRCSCGWQSEFVPKPVDPVNDPIYMIEDAHLTAHVKDGKGIINRFDG